MANDLTDPVAPPPEPPAPPPGPPPEKSTEDLGIDRAFLLMLGRIPFIAILWTLAAIAASAAVEKFGWFINTSDPALEKYANLGPLAVVCAGMLLAAFIDGYYFKVPNWCTLSLVVSGWYIGILHDVGVSWLPTHGSFLDAFVGTMIGFLCLFPALAIGGMGQGDVKMTMGFGSWVCAYFGSDPGIWVLIWSFAVGVIVGGVFGLVMMAVRREFYKNLSNTREIFRDLQVLVTAGPGLAAKRANTRRKDWVRLPYGVPLCVGFLGYLWYVFFLAH